MTIASAGRRRGVVPVLTEAQRLMIAREYVGLNQGELADRLGVGTATVQRAESGKTKPRRTTFMAWSMATGVDLDWLEKGATADDDPDGGGDVVRPKGFEPLTFCAIHRADVKTHVIRGRFERQHDAIREDKIA